jgi:tetratricopeptide (TPR) repeat protein
MGRYDDALAILDKAIGLEPDNADLYYNKGNIPVVRQVRGALRCSTDACAESGQLHACVNKAAALARLKRVAEAAKYYRKAHELNPSFEPPDWAKK